MAKIFISGVSSEFSNYRKVLNQSLLGAGHHPISQEDFTPEHTTLLEMLEKHIKGCDAVLCLVGNEYGWEPPTQERLQHGQGQRFSYTQWEFVLARRHRKKVFIYYPCPSSRIGFASDANGLEDSNRTEKLLLQKKFKENYIEDPGRHRTIFTNEEDLVNVVLASQHKWIDQCDSFMEDDHDVKPVVVIASATLQGVDERLYEEVELVRETIYNITDDYRVIDLYSPSDQELRSCFLKYHNQIVIFHYTGHSMNSALPLKGDSDASESLKTIASLLDQETAIKLAFINAPLLEHKAELFEKRKTSRDIITLVSPVEDKFAKTTVHQFYKSIENHTLKESFERSGACSSWNRLGKGRFRLGDAHNRVSNRALIAYTLTLLTISQIGLILSYFTFTSPAFLAEFAYGLLPGDAESIETLTKAPSFTKITDLQGASADLQKSLDRISNRSNSYGFIIESVRLVIFGACSILGLGVVYRQKLPHEPRFFSGEWFKQKSTLCGLLPAVMLILLALVIYHISFAPIALEKSRRWTATCQFEEPWIDAGEVQGVTSERYKEFHSVRKNGELNRDFWRDLYVRPYLAYLPYSLCTYIGIALPIFYLAILGSRSGWKRFDYLMNELKRQVRIKDEQGIKLAMRESFIRIRTNVKEYLCLSMMLSIGALYESMIGHCTLAEVANIIIALAMLLILLVFTVLIAMLYRYSNICLDVRTKANSQLRLELKEFLPSNLFRDGFIVICLVFSAFVFVYFVNWNLTGG